MDIASLPHPSAHGERIGPDDALPEQVGGEAEKLPGVYVSVNICHKPSVGHRQGGLEN